MAGLGAAVVEAAGVGGLLRGTPLAGRLLHEARFDPHFAYKALHNNDTLYANSLLFRTIYCFICNILQAQQLQAALGLELALGQAHDLPARPAPMFTGELCS